MNFVAIDFETANRDRASACSVGLVRVVNGQIQDSASWLIKPPKGTYFLRDFIEIHGITQAMVQNQPDFLELWPAIKQFVQNDILVAHNASFDMNVLRGLFEKYALAMPDFHYICSLATARKTWNFPSNRLNYLADVLGLELTHHHADSDAKVCAEIMLKAIAQHSCTSLEDLIKKLRLKVCPLQSEIASQSFTRKTDRAVAVPKLETQNQTAATT